MESVSIAPCGVVCELCIGYQRQKNRCGGCLADGSKPGHCAVCSIRICQDKAEEHDLCIICGKFPCRRLKDLEKRYTSRYGESPTENMRIAAGEGLNALFSFVRAKWTCIQCGSLLSAHRDRCLVCGNSNPNYPARE